MIQIPIWRYRHLILHKAWADFRAESTRTYLGVLWWVLDPLINTLIYYIVFGVFFNRGDAEFVPFLVAGIVGWLWFFNGVTSGSVSIMANMGIIRQVSINKIVFPACRVLVSTYKFAFSMLVLFGILFIFRYTPNTYWLLLFPVMAVEFLLIASCAFLLASVVPFVPDLHSMVTYVLRLLFFLSCVMYRLEWLPPRAQYYLQFNPMVHMLNAYRDVLMDARHPNWAVLGAMTVLSMAGILVGAALIACFDGIYAKRIVQ